ncbi:MAG: hypothetical protein ACTSUT_04495 [Promethearchaeota archaeon]
MTRIRPYGCALFFIAIDAMGSQIYTTSPSGIYRSFKAYALGNGETPARKHIQDNYKENLNFDEIINLALNAIKVSIDEDMTKENIRLSYIKSEEKKFKICSKEEIDKFLSVLK